MIDDQSGRNKVAVSKAAGSPLSKEMETCTLVLLSFERSCRGLSSAGSACFCTQEVSGSILLGSILVRVAD